MRHFLPLVFLLIVVAPVKADQKWYFLDKEAVEEAYDKVTCQQGPDVIRNRLQADDKKPEGEKMSGLYRNALQACLNRIAAGEKFDLDISVRNRLIAGLRVVKPLKLCRENEVPLELDSRIAKTWMDELKARGSFKESLRSELDQPLQTAASSLKCGEVPKG